MSTGGRVRPQLHPSEGIALGGDAVRERIGEGPRLTAEKFSQERIGTREAAFSCGLEVPLWHGLPAASGGGHG